MAAVTASIESIPSLGSKMTKSKELARGFAGGPSIEVLEEKRVTSLLKDEQTTG